MASTKLNKNREWGGRRNGAGRPKNSGTKTKICVSVREDNWNTAVKRWNQKPSWLVDQLVLRYVQTGGSILETEAAI
jgi:hypothetical protein